MKIPVKHILIASWITAITGIYVFYGLSYLTAIQSVNNLVKSVLD
jgi:hypothetical protein